MQTTLFPRCNFVNSDGPHLPLHLPPLSLVQGVNPIHFLFPPTELVIPTHQVHWLWPNEGMISTTAQAPS